MKDFEELTELEQNEIIMQIANKLDKQEIWYWEGLVHLLREQDKRINKAIEYIKESIEVGNIKASGRGLIWVNFSTEEIENLDKLLSILEGSDKE